MRGRCHACSRTGERARGNFRERGYTSAWSRYSLAFRREYPLCGMRPGGVLPVMSECYAKGLATPAYQVDHVEPVAIRPDLMWDAGNHQSLCRSCGARKSQAGL